MIQCLQQQCQLAAWGQDDASKEYCYLWMHNVEPSTTSSISHDLTVYISTDKPVYITVYDKSWLAARDLCHGLGGHIYTPKSFTELQELYTKIGYYWIGK